MRIILEKRLLMALLAMGVGHDACGRGYTCGKMASGLSRDVFADFGDDVFRMFSLSGVLVRFRWVGFGVFFGCLMFDFGRGGIFHALVFFCSLRIVGDGFSHRFDRIKYMNY